MWKLLEQGLNFHARNSSKQLKFLSPPKPVVSSRINYVFAFPCRFVCAQRVGSLEPLSLRPSTAFILADPRRATQRLSLINRHLDQRPQLEINTPYSTERISQESDDLPYTPLERHPPDLSKVEEESKKAFSNMSLQAPHPSLLIPGPIEFDDAVLQSMSHYRYAKHEVWQRCST